MRARTREHSDDIAYPSSVGFLLIHLGCLAAIWTGVVLLAPFAWLGLRTGHRIHTGLTQQQMRRVIGGIIILTGASLLIHVFVK